MIQQMKFSSFLQRTQNQITLKFSQTQTSSSLPFKQTKNMISTHFIFFSLLQKNHTSPQENLFPGSRYQTKLVRLLCRPLAKRISCRWKSAFHIKQVYSAGNSHQQYLFLIIQMRKIVSKNPYTGKILAQMNFLNSAELEQKIQKAARAYELHKSRGIKERGDMIGSVANTIQRHRKTIAEIITTEMGKPITQSLMEVDKSISFCNHYSKHFNDVVPTQIKTDAKVKTLIKYLPIGPIYVIVPFNFPFYLNFKAGLPNLLLGNVLITRNADSLPQLGKLTEDIMIEAGLDSGEYQNVYSSPEQLDEILAHPEVAGVNFTGSSRTGAIIAQKAGKYLKKSVMELGGNDPFVVLTDANLKQAVEDAYIARSRNAGQICFSPKRFIIVKEHYETFKKMLIEKLSQAKYGDPMDPNVQVGPLAREDLHTNLEDQLSRLPKGWKISWKRDDVKKPFYPITVTEGTDETFDEEMFGPVFNLFKAENQEHAIKLANAGTYGLGASVYGERTAENVLDRIRAGMGFVNTFTKSDYMFPSGGVGRSGYGRECGVEGSRAFANVRVHYVN